MSLRKMLQFSTGALFLVLPWIGGPVIGEISNDFSQCLHFFYNNTPPNGITGNVYQPICQRYKNQYHFASLYHREHRTPLYSAYILENTNGTRPNTSWKYEPQLASRSNDPEMQDSLNITDQNVIESQAVNEDYRNQDFTRGHLTPSSHQNTTEDREATFTLTNIVPQKEGSNSGPWNLLEEHMLKKSKECKEPMYVITGVMPYESEPIKMNNRVLVPEYLWSAYCCKSKSGNPPFLTFAAVGRNDNNSDNTIVPMKHNAKKSVRGFDVKKMPLLDLEGIFQNRSKMPELSLFKGNCG